jgi:hypothetical protein
MENHHGYKYTEDDFHPDYKHLMKGTKIPTSGSVVTEAEAHAE